MKSLVKRILFKAYRFLNKHPKLMKAALKIAPKRLVDRMISLKRAGDASRDDIERERLLSKAFEVFCDRLSARG